MTPFSATERAMIVQLFEVLDVLVEVNLAGVRLTGDRLRQVLDLAAESRRLLLPTLSRTPAEDAASASVH